MFRNHHPKAWEEYATYGPQIATDVVNTLLNIMVKTTFFGSLANGDSEEQRASSIIVWRTYLYTTTSQKAK